MKKHRNDIIRISAEIVLNPCVLPREVREDMRTFIDAFDVTPLELKISKLKVSRLRTSKKFSEKPICKGFTNGLFLLSLCLSFTITPLFVILSTFLTNWSRYATIHLPSTNSFKLSETFQFHPSFSQRYRTGLLCMEK